jgi:uncharacterized damage-inducible protein DinB
MLKDHFLNLLKYNDWATREAAEPINKFGKKDERIIGLLSHIVSAQKVWLNRTLQRDVHSDPWQKHTVEECISHSTSRTSEWINLLESMSEKDLDKRIEYANSKGEIYNNTIKDIVLHLINHSTYHRAQIATLVRQAGGEPARTDYIVYQRQIQK